MVDRYSISKDPHAFVNAKGPEWQPIYNAHPTQKLPVISKNGTVSFYHWGLMAKWSNNKVMSSKLFNLDIQRALEKPSFRKALENRRCVAVADGYFQWRQIGKKQHTPYYHYLQGQALFGLAAIWEASEDIEGNEVESFMCLMQQLPAGGDSSEERPVVIGADDVKKWLDPALDEDGMRGLIMKSTTLEMATHPVSPAISDPKNNGKSLVQPAMPADQHGNYTLF